jgi:hypothetical protein
MVVEVVIEGIQGEEQIGFLLGNRIWEWIVRDRDNSDDGIDKVRENIEELLCRNMGNSREFPFRRLRLLISLHWCPSTQPHSPPSLRFRRQQS